MWLYVHTRIVIRTYAYIYTRIYAYTCASDVSLLFRPKTFLCVSLLWKRKSLKKQWADNRKLTYCTKLMEMLQTRTSHRFMYLLNNKKNYFICFICCCWWIRTKRRMLLKLRIQTHESSGDLLSKYSCNMLPESFIKFYTVSAKKNNDFGKVTL